MKKIITYGTKNRLKHYNKIIFKDIRDVALHYFPVEKTC